MLRNFFKTALRTIFKNKVISFVNLLGLATGMTAAIFIFLWVQNEITFDNYQPKNIYRLTSAPVNDKDNKWERSPQPLADAAAAGIPEVEKTAMLLPYSWLNCSVNNKVFAEKKSAWVDRNWFSMFKYDFIQGNAVNFTQNPYSIVLTERMAKKYFGDAIATGQIIKIDTVNYTVAGVVKNNALNSSFQYDVMIQFDAYLNSKSGKKYRNDWNNANYITFVQLRPSSPAAAAGAKLTAIVNRLSGDNQSVETLVPLRDLYFETGINSTLPHGNKSTTYIFCVMGLLLLITACINYVNLTTARASQRAKEIGIRKIVGAEKLQLFMQFIAESLVVSFLALLITLLLIRLLLPVFNAITEIDFTLPITSLPMWQILLGTLLFVTVLNGVYPALLLSSFSPLNVFKGKSVLKLRDGSIRKGLVVFQFTLSAILITGTIVMYRQLHLIQSTKTGYNIQQVVTINLPGSATANVTEESAPAFFEGVKHDLAALPGVVMVSSGSGEIEDIGNTSGAAGAKWDGKDTSYHASIYRLSVDENYTKMFALQLKSGRFFRNEKEDAHSFMINETAEAEFNMHKPVVGQRFVWSGDTGKIIGIVKDFHFRSLHDKIGPMVISMNDERFNNLFIKIAPGNIARALSGISGVWNKYAPKQAFDYSFLDDNFNALYKTDAKTSKLILIFCIVAVVIAALGLFGLATFTAERRTKEIGIRKVLGASVQQISLLLSKEFVVLVCVAIIIATPAAWWAMHTWLNGFAYRITLSPWLFVVSAAIALLVAILSVSMQAVKAAMANPVKALKEE